MTKKLNSLKLSKKLDSFLNKIISPEFIEIAHKWACYNGSPIYLHDVSIENKGVFEYKYLTNKIDVGFDENGMFNVHISEEKNEETIDIYDVSIIRNSSRCCDYDAMLLISKRIKSVNNKKIELKIFIINDDDNNNDNFPKFTKIKNDFESGNYYGTNLLYNFLGEYKLMSPLNYDRILCYTAIYYDLEKLENMK